MKLTVFSAVVLCTACLCQNLPAQNQNQTVVQPSAPTLPVESIPQPDSQISATSVSSQPIPLSEVPDAVQNTIRQQVGNRYVTVTPRFQNGKTIYQINYLLQGTQRQLQIDQTGAVLDQQNIQAQNTPTNGGYLQTNLYPGGVTPQTALPGLNTLTSSPPAGSTNRPLLREAAGAERRRALAVLPPAVRQTVESRLKDRQINVIRQSRQNSHPFYKIDSYDGNSHIELIIDADGTLLQQRP